MKTVNIIIYSLVLLFFAQATLVKAQDGAKEKLVGVWQASEAMGSGWSDVYRFFEDGKFIFHISQMNCAAREISYSGTWEIENNKIVLSITERVLMTGGKLVRAEGSCGSKYDLVDATEKKVTLKTPAQIILTLGQFKKDDLERWTTRFGKQQFWKYNPDPSQYP